MDVRIQVGDTAEIIWPNEAPTTTNTDNLDIYRSVVKDLGHDPLAGR